MRMPQEVKEAILEALACWDEPDSPEAFGEAMEALRRLVGDVE